MSFTISVDIRWSDLDPNFHLRHSVYYDWGAYCRMRFLREHGLDAQAMHSLQVGPVIFREECVFRKEILFGDAVTIDLELLSARSDYSRWTLKHTIFKGEGNIAAVLTLEGAWIDTARRKLTAPPSAGINAFSAIPKAAGFTDMQP
jgi:acyl-CoA thioester hydrolase